MKLSARLILLGISGPIAGLGLFLIVATSASIKLAQIAKLQMTQLFDQNNRTRLLMATTMIQQEAQVATEQILEDSTQLHKALQPLRLDGQGRLIWRGQAISLAQARRQLNPVLQLPLSMPSETAAIFYHVNGEGWRRVTGVSSDGQSMSGNGWVTAANQREIEQLYLAAPGKIVPRNTMLRRDGEWRMTRITPLHPRQSNQRLALVVSVSDDAATRILSTSANLFPFDQHRVAFFSSDPTGKPICTYQAPTPTTCAELLEKMKRSGGVPTAHRSTTADLSEREVSRPGLPGKGASAKETLFIATFPYWNWITVISVEGELLTQTLQPMRQSTIEILVVLVVSSAVLVMLCGYAALRFARSINRQLLQLATAADAIAGGDRGLKLDYPDDDALGKLVRAFNAMANAVYAREDSLRAQIHVLEINISEQALQGQVCSITDQPGFNRLSDRARTMRERRQRLEKKAEGER
jgi:putative effector of murein hydrolase LrgA (UPF0299 family)